MWLHLGDGSRHHSQCVKKYCAVRNDWPGGANADQEPVRGDSRPGLGTVEAALRNSRPETLARVSRTSHSRAWRRELRLSTQERVPRSDVPPACPRLGPNSTAHTTETSPNPTLATPAAREHTWSSSLMSMNAGTLMVQTTEKQTAYTQTTPTGKESRAPGLRGCASQLLPGCPVQILQCRVTRTGGAAGANPTARSDRLWRRGEADAPGPVSRVCPKTPPQRTASSSIF